MTRPFRADFRTTGARRRCTRPAGRPRFQSLGSGGACSSRARTRSEGTSTEMTHRSGDNRSCKRRGFIGRRAKRDAHSEGTFVRPGAGGVLRGRVAKCPRAGCSTGGPWRPGRLQPPSTWTSLPADAMSYVGRDDRAEERQATGANGSSDDPMLGPGSRRSLDASCVHTRPLRRGPGANRRMLALAMIAPSFLPQRAGTSQAIHTPAVATRLGSPSRTTWEASPVAPPPAGDASLSHTAPPELNVSSGQRLPPGRQRSIGHGAFCAGQPRSFRGKPAASATSQEGSR